MTSFSLNYPKSPFRRLRITDYIHNNPIEIGIVDKPEEYVYSSARDYCGKNGLMDVVLVE